MATNSKDARIAASWFTDHGDWLRRRAVNALGEQQADDSLQSLFLKVMKRGHLGEVHEPAKYLARAQSNMFATYWRQPSKVEIVLDGVAGEPEDGFVNDRLERMQDAELVRDCLLLLKARHRTVLELRMSGTGRGAIAQHLGLSPHAVTQLTRRALDALDYRLKQSGFVRG